MARTLSYPLRSEPHLEDGGYLAYLPGCQTWGETFEAAAANAEEALTVFLETLAANGDPLPEASQIERSTSLGYCAFTRRRVTPRSPSISARDLVRALEKAGGSHLTLRHPAVSERTRLARFASPADRLIKAANQREDR